jgi:hypothetical protein
MTNERSADPGRRNIPLIAAAIVFIVHLAANPHYGYFRDELYFIICGFHPQFGYVDQPPVVPLLSAGSQLFGHSLFLLRAVPAAFAAGGVYVTCLLAAEYGGGAFAQVLAALVFFFTGVLSSFGMKVSTDEVGLFTWPLLALLIVRITKGADPRLWLAAGAVAGLSIESKYSVFFFLAALLAGLLLAPQRRTMFNPWFAGGLGLALLIALPNLIWQWHYGFPILQLLEAGQHGKNVVVGPLMYLVQEILITGLFIATIWIIGLGWLARMPQYRFLAYAYVLLIAQMIVMHGKHYYPAAVYPILIAAGALQIERWTIPQTRPRTLARTVTVALVVAFGLLFLPLSLPILPEAAFVSYDTALGNALHVSRSSMETEHHRDEAPLPGDWADMHGWPEMAAAVASIYDALPPGERAQAVVMASNYGEASAIEFFTPHVPVVSGHNQYWLWGPQGHTGNVLIDIDGDCGAKEHFFKHAARATTFSNRWAIAYETNIPIMLCRGIREPLAVIWPSRKDYM